MEHVVLSVRYEEIQNENCINQYERTENIEISWTKNAKWGSFSLFSIANIVEAEQNISVLRVGSSAWRVMIRDAEYE